MSRSSLLSRFSRGVMISAAMLLASDCSGPTTLPFQPDPAGQTAVDYLWASDRGDAQTECRLSETTPDDIADCVRVTSSQKCCRDLLAEIKVLAVYRWPQQDGSPDGRAAVLQTTLTNGNVGTPDLVTLVPGPGDPPWIVDRLTSYPGDPQDETAVLAAVERIS